MRKALRLLPLPVCIAFSLAAHAADDRPADWRLCPVQDAIPAFPDAQPATHLTSEERAGQPTDIEGDEISGPESNRRITGNVALRRGAQRSEERRGGKECVSTGRYRVPPDH